MALDFKPGQHVRLKTDPGRTGVTTGKALERSGIQYLQVVFHDGPQHVPADHLELMTDTGNDPLDLFLRGRLARAEDLRRVLTHARLAGRLANVIYSMDSTGADFYAYQFKPLVKLLTTATSGILIADEVGLGKTIEAGLIWTELRSRFDFQRLLVVCPAMLREKWARELRQKFGVEAEIVDAAGLYEKLRQAANEPHTTRFAAVASLQGMRPPRGWREAMPRHEDSAALRLATLLDAQEHKSPLLELTVIDEAHYLRNPETMTAAAGRLLRGVTEYLVLLSATPVHLKNTDLFQLVHLVDADTFHLPQDFDELIEANAPIVRSRDLVASGHATTTTLRTQLTEALQHPLLRESRQLATLLAGLPSDAELQQPSCVTDLARRLENINLLGHVVTRTRKRDVTEWRVVREAHAEAIPLSPVEREFYAAVTEVVREYCARNKGHEGFLLVMPQRQMSSSMAAALRTWKGRQDRLDEETYEDLGNIELVAPDPQTAAEAIGPITRLLIERSGTCGDYALLRAHDSKYARLLDRLQAFFTEHPRDKAVLFAFFRPTLAYLRERLTEDGIVCYVLHGGTPDKDHILDLFRDDPGPAVLLSSEVGSEGIDLQFCWLVINYDLPWNPMRVEQRIGRLDRLGQPAPKILIWNLFYDDTIDARIYHRLYERLRLFEKTLGGLEPILGELIHDLTRDLLSHHLTPVQEAERIDQTRQAVENKSAEENRLEDEAIHLFAFRDYILNQVIAARELSRKVDAYDLRAYVTDFFAEHYPDSQLRQTHDECDFEITLSNMAKQDLDTFVRAKHLTGQTRLHQIDTREAHCRFDNSVVPRRVTTGLEILNQFHPLVRFVTERMRSIAHDFRVAVAVQLDGAQGPEALEAGDYAFAVQRWAMRGLQDVEYLAFAAAALNAPAGLSPEDAERLITAGALRGTDWLAAGTEIDLPAAARVLNDPCLAECDKAYEARWREIEAQNQDRVTIQERTLERHLAHQRARLEEILQRHRSHNRPGLAAATEGKIRALEARVEWRQREIQDRRRFEHHAQEICVGVIRLLERTS